MASAQVLPNSAVSSRKQELLDAGKRRLEEFRKKKAADRAKKAGSATQPPIADSVVNDKQLLNGVVQVPDSEGAGTSGRIGVPISQRSILVASDAENLHSRTSKSALEPQVHTYTDLTVPKSQISFSSDLPPGWPKQEEHQRSNVSGSVYLTNIELDQQNHKKIDHYGLISTEGRSWDMASSDQYNLRVKDALPDRNDVSNEIPRTKTSYADSVDIFSSGRSGSTMSQNNSGIGDPQILSKDFNFGDRDSTRQVPALSATHETYPRRNRPTFLDSLNIPRVSSTSGLSNSQPQLLPDDVDTSAYHDHFGGNGNLESHFEGSDTHSNGNANALVDQTRCVNYAERKLDLPQQQNEDFGALEQHIEDLTQEKFSLQRALEASKSLAESLASENSSLTESYNQQGGVVAQLKSEIESVHAQIKGLLVEQESIRIQYANAQLECNAADERAKLLASEVIGLEEKALRLRSNELKLDKELEKSNAEVASCKKKMLSLERERQDMEMTIGALQEEKKLLQSKLRKASTSGMHFDNVEQKSKKNMSTSTDDLEILHDGNAQLSPAPTAEEIHASKSSSPRVDNLQLLQKNGGFGLDGSAMIFPSDQVQLIQNIDALLSELMEEKEELSQALVAEISTSSKLKDLNKELSQRLDAQVLRLEFLTTQSMTKDNAVARQPTDSQTIQENMSYADEGDEVVERVLGWVMKLFPGGPSKRRTSKLV